jgi:membrane protein YdbS with pleckstrin-like domain
VQKTRSIILKPSIRTTTAYCAFALSVTISFIIATIIQITNLLETIRLDANFGISGLIMSLLILAIVIGVHLWLKSTTYTITEHDARACCGLLAKFDDCIELSAVTSIRVTQGWLQRALNIGNLTLYTASFHALVFRDINEPEAWKEEIEKLVSKAKNETNYYY